MNTFSNRLILQKLVYLLQAFGIFLGYRFSWYLRGPYSSRLAADGFELEPHFKHIAPVIFTDSSIEERFREFLQFVQPHTKNPNALEIMASIHFLTRLHPGIHKTEVLQRVKAKQPVFTSSLVNEAWERLKQVRLI